MFCHCLQTN